MTVEWMEQDGTRLWRSIGSDAYEGYFRVTILPLEMHSLPYGKVIAALSGAREHFEAVLNTELRKAKA